MNYKVEVRHRIIPQDAIDCALRLIHTDILSCGLDDDTLAEWLWAANWFPHLRWHADIVRLAQWLPKSWRDGLMCDPQILLQCPHKLSDPVPEITMHVDQEPEWANGRRYTSIVGIPLSPWNERNGGLMVPHRIGPAALNLNPGDAVWMAPDQPHSGGVNLTGSIRYGIYFRWVGEDPNA